MPYSENHLRLENHPRIDFSANDLFKAQYGRVMRWALLLALLITALIVWLTPDIPSQPYVLRENFIEDFDFEVIPDIVTPEIQPQVAPILPREIEPVEDDLAEDYEMPNPFDYNFEGEVTPPADASQYDGFRASSANPVLKFFAKPDYPEMARLSHIEGVVILKVLVGKDGLVDNVAVIQSVHPLVDNAAIKAARKCRFKPGTQRSMPVKAWIAVPYSFHLK